jgi:RNA polymerase sigma factor (sigma-70 family)
MNHPGKHFVRQSALLGVMTTIDTVRGDIGRVMRPNRAQECERVFKESGAALWRSILAMSGGRRDIAEDAVAEAFSQALTTPTHIDNLQAWLYKVAFRVALREMKQEQRQAPGVELAYEDPQVQELMDALRALPPQQRGALALHYLEGAPVREIAWALGVSQATARVHLHRGRKRLRTLLSDPEDEKS